jgi:MoaA/NifB/PqqE/SkfB family radical SAM enzyme
MKNVTILISNRCNMRCSHCMSDSGSPAASETVFSHRLQLFAKLLCLGVERIVVSGGEPLLRKPDVYAFLDDAYRAGLVTGLLTNGLLLDKQTVDELSGRHIGRVAVSIYSADIAGYNSAQQRKYGRRIHRALSALEVRGIPYVISIPTHGGNVSHTLHVIGLIVRFGLSPQRIRILYISGAGRGASLPSIASQSTWSQLAVRVQDMKRRYAVSLELTASSFGVLSQAYDRGCPIRHFDADRPAYLADPHISENGDLVLCGLLIRDPAYQVANLITDSIEQIRNRIGIAASAMANSVGAHRCPIGSDAHSAPCVLHEVVL